MEEDTLETKKRKLPNSEEIGKNVSHQCDQCEYTGSKSALHHRKQFQHKGVRYPCDQCVKTYSTVSHMK